MSFHEEEVLGKAYDARLMRRLLGYLRPHTWFVGRRAAGARSATPSFSSCPPYLVKIAIDQYIAQGDLAGLERHRAASIWPCSSASFSLEYAQTYMMQMIGQRIMFDMRMQIYAHLQRLDLSFYDRNPVGRLMTRVTTDVDVINDLFTSGVVAAFGDLFMLVGIMVTLLWMDWRLALITFSVLPLILVLAQWFRRNVRESYRKVRARIARINAFLNEHINGMATVQLFRREQVNYGGSTRINREHRDANVEQIFFYAVFLPAVEFVAAIATALILWYGGGFVMSGHADAGVARGVHPVRGPLLPADQRHVGEVQHAAGGDGVFGADLSAPRYARSRSESSQRPVERRSARVAQSPGPSQQGHIVFDDVSFAYNATRTTSPRASRRASQRVVRSEAGRAGRHRRGDGSGQVDAHQPAAALLRRHERPDPDRRRRHPRDGSRPSCAGCSGSCCRTCTCSRARSPATSGSATSRSTTRACGTRRRAVHAASLHRGAARRLRRAASRSAGATLSVGQKQLLSFARALAFDPAVLILDEATSSVDTETELLIRDALHVLMSGRTTLAIAHRLSTIQDMDKILVFHKGKLREAGSHQQLLGMRGIYYKLFQLQYKGAAGDNEDRCDAVSGGGCRAEPAPLRSRQAFRRASRTSDSESARRCRPGCARGRGLRGGGGGCFGSSSGRA